MTEQRRRPLSILAWGTCLVTLVVVATTSVLVVLNLPTIRDPTEANLVEIVLSISFALLGGLVASRQPSNTLGWVFLALALLNALPGVAGQYTRYALLTQPGAPFTAWIPWVGDVASELVYPAGLAALALLLTPSGHVLSPRWRWVAWAGAVVTAVLVVLTMTDAGVGEPSVPNPTVVPAINELAAGFANAAFISGLAVLALAGSSVIIRLRWASGEERLQLRWIAATAAFAIGINLLSVVIPLVLVSEEVAIVVSRMAIVIGFGIALPAGFAVAMLRYRLYDLDLLLNRTALYGAVTVLLVGAFFVANVVAQRAVESLFHQQRSDLVAAALGVTAGLAFAPMRRAIRPLVDRALPARSRLTLLFTDIVESTQAIVDLGDEQWREVLDRYRALVRQELSRHRGREVNTAGDAFFAVFDRPINAVRCATAMRNGVKTLRLRVRTGIHSGEVEMRGEQVTGLAVHAAARVMSLAGEDQVLITGDVAQLLHDALPLRDAGRRELRGVPGTWQLYEVR